MVMEEEPPGMELDSERIPVPQVQKSSEEPHIDMIKKDTNNSRRKPRLRKKALHAAIRKQMEFYFSDANLSKDRFLNYLIKEDPYVDLNTFTIFNKIKELTTDINRIAKALQGSTILSLSEDGMKVCRTTPIVIRENTDDCTVYVQNVPPDSDHQMLSSIFSVYGQVVYVSVPRFKNNRKIKGFAFIEFDTPESAKKCLKAFKKKGGLLPSHTTPDELLSISTFDNAEKDVTLARKQSKQTEANLYTAKAESNEEVKDIEMQTTNMKEGDVSGSDVSENQNNKNKDKAKKRKHKDLEYEETEETEKEMHSDDVKAKREKSVDIDHGEMDLCNEERMQEELESTKSVLLNEVQMSDRHEDEQIAADENATQGTEEEDNINDTKKKRKKRKKRSRMEDFSYSMGLQVMSKRDWKHLRNKYLELQRSKMKQLKQHLRKTRWTQWSNYERNKPEKEESEEKDKTTNQELPGTCRFSITPGVIIKIEMDNPCVDPKSFKMDLKNNNTVKYIDVEKGSYVAYVRCDTTEAAQQFAQKSDEQRHMTILEGEEEKRYWDKVVHDREEKLSKKVKVKQRGRNKLLKKAEKELGKHIKFDEV